MAYRWLSKVMPSGGRVRRNCSQAEVRDPAVTPVLIGQRPLATPSVWDSLEQLVEPGSGYLPEAFDQGLDGLCAAIAKATRSEQSWQGRIDAGAAALLSFLEAHGDWARLVALEAPLSGAATAACTEKLHAALLPVLEQARESVIVGAKIKPPSRLLAELVVLGSLSLIRARMLSAEERSLSELCPALCAEILAPYLGRAAQRLDESAAPACPSERKWCRCARTRALSLHSA